MPNIRLWKSTLKLPQTVIVRAPGLLPMLYTCRELAEELGLPDSTLRDWLVLGAPHSRDNQQHLWVNGQEFATWVQAQRKPRRAHRCSEAEAYCLRCQTVITLVNPVTRVVKGKLSHTRGQCPHCRHTIIRGGRYDRTFQLSQGQNPSELSPGCAPSRP